MIWQPQSPLRKSKPPQKVEDSFEAHSDSFRFSIAASGTDQHWFLWTELSVLLGETRMSFFWKIRSLEELRKLIFSDIDVKFQVQLTDVSTFLLSAFGVWPLYVLFTKLSKFCALQTRNRRYQMYSLQTSPKIVTFGVILAFFDILGKPLSGSS